jgi:hypothetical protein
MVDTTPRSSLDAGADAARLLQRLGFAVLAIGTPCAESLSSRAIFVFFPIGVALLIVAAMLDPVRGAADKVRNAFFSPINWCALALLAWVVLSLAWTPFPSSAVQHLGKLVGTAVLAFLAIVCMRDHVRAGDLYLFPLGVAFAMLAVLFVALAAHAGLQASDGRIGRAGVSLVVLMWPAMAGLAARGRNGYARLVLILGLLAAAIILFSPIAPAMAPALARWFYHAKLASLDEPFPPLAAAAEILLHDPLRLFTGHGFDAAIQGVANGLLPPRTPRVALFEIWYENGAIGAALAAAIAWLGFRKVGALPPRIAPYMVAALAADLTLAFLAEDFSQMWWATVLAVSAISAAAAYNSLYRTRRPAATMPRPTL